MRWIPRRHRGLSWEVSGVLLVAVRHAPSCACHDAYVLMHIQARLSLYKVRATLHEIIPYGMSHVITIVELFSHPHAWKQAICLYERVRTTGACRANTGDHT